MLKNEMYYICSPLSADTAEGIHQNMMEARRYMELIHSWFGYRTVAPHAYLPELLDDHNPKERELGLAFGMTLLSWCSGMIVCGKKISSGMRAEIEKAREMQIPVHLFIEEENHKYLVSYQKEAAYEMQIPQKNI